VSALLAALQGAGLATTPVVIGLVLLLGLTFAFAIPAIQAMVPDLVDREHLASAMAMSSLTFNGARAIGPVVGALVVAHWGISVALALNSLSYLGLVVGLLAVRPRQETKGRAAAAVGWSESLRIVRHDTALLALLMVVAAISITQDPVSTLTPGFSSEIFHRADTLTGLLVGAFGLGSTVAAATAAARNRDPGRRLAPGCVLMGIGMLGFALAPNLPFAFAGLFLGGFSFMVANTAATTALALESPPEQRGRVMALWSLCFLGTRPVASLSDGALASTVSLRAAGIALTVPVLIAGAAMAVLRRRVPRLREIGVCPAVIAEPPAPDVPGVAGRPA
jgi:MFS family permease